MPENPYDDEAFFAAYSRFPRSVEGLSAAGEWHELQKLLPEFLGKRVLDIGCGFGWHCRYAAEQGASLVLGTDIAAKMLSAAREKTAFPQVKYEQIAMEELNFAPRTFEVVLSSLAFHYTPDFTEICRRVARWLTPNGDFIFSVEHPIFTAYGTQDWIYDGAGRREHWPVDRYFDEGQRDALFLGQHVTKYHKTLTTYLRSLLQAGLTITSIVEPQPAPALLETVPDMADELRRPMMLLLAAKKPA